MELSAGKIISVVIALLLLGILIPIGITELEAFTSTNTALQTVITTVIPIVAVVGLLMYFIPKHQE